MESVRTGMVVLTFLLSWQEYESNREFNGDCNLVWVGRVFKFINRKGGLLQ
jgi:hypothetical protein